MTHHFEQRKDAAKLEKLVASEEIPAQSHSYKYLLLVQLLAGAGSGVINKTAIAPLERIKILYQVQGMMPADVPRKYKGIMQTLSAVYREEGLKGWYRGNGANCIRIIPNYACKFVFNDVFKDMVRTPGSNAPLTWYQMMAAGTAAGLAQTCITYPLELTRTRLSLSSDMKHGVQYRGITHCLASTVKYEGFRGLYKGIGPTFLSGAPYTGLQMTFYELLKRWFPKSTDAKTGKAKTSQFWSLMAGAGAGLISQTITYPGDTVRRRMQANGLHGTKRVYDNSWQCLTRIIQLEGWQGLFSGCKANVVRSVPGTAIQFWSYELIKRGLGVEPISA